MKHMKKGLIAAVALAIIACTIVVMAVPAAAAAITGFDILSNSKYAKTYTLSTSGRTTPYTNKNLSTRGTVNGKSSTAYIDNAADELYIKDVGCTNGTYWARVSYPISSSKRVEAYIPLSSLTKNNGGHAKSTSTGKFYCSLRERWGNDSRYYVVKGDTVYLVATSGSKYQILYPVSSGMWRLAWCNASDYQKYCKTSTTSTAAKVNTATSANTVANIDASTGMIDVTSYFAEKSIILRSVQNGKFMTDASIATTSTNRSNFSISCNYPAFSSKGIFTISSMTSDGWVGIKSNYTKNYLSARTDVANTPVRPVSGKIEAWECFRIYLLGSDFYIRAQANNKFLCVRVDISGSPVQAIADSPSKWERFSIIDVKTNQDIASIILESMLGKTVAYIKNGTQYTANYGAKNLSAKYGCYGHCTWYAYGRFLEVNGIALKTAPNAKYWLSQNRNDSRVNVLYGANKIASKSIAVNSSGDYGHVMFVEYVTYNSNGTPAYVYFTESNVKPSFNGKYDAGIDCVLQKLSYNEFVSKKNPAGYITAK